MSVCSFPTTSTRMCDRQLPAPSLPQIGSSESEAFLIRINFESMSGDCFLYQFINSDAAYNKMTRCINSVHEDVQLQFNPQQRGQYRDNSSDESAEDDSDPDDQNEDIFRPGDTVIVRVDVEIGNNKTYERAKLLTSDDRGQCATVELLDRNTTSPVLTVSSKDMFPYVYTPETNLPPRRRFLKLAFLSAYSDTRNFRNLLNSVSRDLLTGPLVVEFVKEHNNTINGEEKVDGPAIIRGPKYPLSQYPLGFNGLFLELLINSINEPSLPDVNYCKDKIYITRGIPNGDCYVGVYSSASEHLQSIIENINYNSKTHKKLLSKQGMVTTPQQKKLYLAKYYKDSCFYRAKIDKKPSDLDRIFVRFIDFGTVQRMSTKELIPASEVDYLLTLFPPQAIRVRLHGVTSLNGEKFKSFIESVNSADKYLLLKTVKAPSNETIAEVEIRTPQVHKDSRFDSINAEVAATMFMTGKDAQPIDKLQRITAQLCPSVLESVHVESQPVINTHCIFWNNPSSSPVVRLAVGETLDVKLKHLEKRNVVIFPTERLCYRIALENQMYLEYMKPWNSLPLLTPFHLKMHKFFMLTLTEPHQRVVRVKLLENWATLQSKLNQDFKDVQVNLIDYGTSTNVKWATLRPLDQRFCAFPPFAVQGRVEVPTNAKFTSTAGDVERLAFIEDGHEKWAEVECSHLNGKRCTVKILSLTYDANNLPFAGIRLDHQTQQG